MGNDGIFQKDSHNELFNSDNALQTNFILQSFYFSFIFAQQFVFTKLKSFLVIFLKEDQTLSLVTNFLKNNNQPMV